MTSVRNGPNRAWNELDRMLRLWARQVESGKPMTREECLEIFSGPNGEYPCGIPESELRRSFADNLIILINHHAF